MPDLASLQRDPQAFRGALAIDTDAGPRSLGAILDGWQRADFLALDPGWRQVAGIPGPSGPLRGWLERPRGHSKTADVAAMVSWVLFASRRRLAGVVAAGDADQARLLRDAVDRLCRGNPWLGSLLDVQRERIVNKHTGSELTVLTADAPTSYGLTPDFIVCDELTHWPRRELWDSLLSAPAKRSSCLLLVIGNAGFVDSWQWGTREGVRTDPAWYFSRLDGPQASWITAERLAEQRRLLPAIAFARVWLNEWSSGSGDALDPADIEGAVTLAGPAHEREQGWAYVAGLDLGLTRDATALCVVAKHVGFVERRTVEMPALTGVAAALADCGLVETRLTSSDEVSYISGNGRCKLVDLLIRRPESGNTGSRARAVDLAAVEAAILDVHARLGLSLVACDPWQAALLIQRLQSRGVPMEAVPFSGPNLSAMASATLDAFTQRTLELYDDPALLADLRALRIVERTQGIRLESPRVSAGSGTRHGDAATALSLALHAARRVVGSESRRVAGPLVLWP